MSRDCAFEFLLDFQAELWYCFVLKGGLNMTKIVSITMAIIIMLFGAKGKSKTKSGCNSMLICKNIFGKDIDTVSE